jgi:hypothetical protein
MLRTVSIRGAQYAEHSGCLKRQQRIYPGENLFPNKRVGHAQNNPRVGVEHDRGERTSGSASALRRCGL